MPAIRVPLTQGAYEARSVIASAQRLLNLYPERNPQGQTSPTTLYQTPGLTPLGVPPLSAPVRGLYTATNGQLFAAIGDQVYYVKDDFTFAVIGTTVLRSTPIVMGDNGTTMVIVDGSSAGWTVDLTSHAFAAISDPAFYGSNFVEEMDTYLIFNKPGTGIFYTSDSNAVTFDPLYFAQKSGYADGLGGIAVRNRNIWLIGSQASSEIWYNAGGADFPFQIMPGPFIQFGVAAIYSIAKFGGNVFWLGTDVTGNSFVLQGHDFKVDKISTPAIEWIISQYSVISDAVAFCYEQQGHSFYWIRFPSANNGLGADWVYDLTTQLWHERSWLNPTTCQSERSRVSTHAFAYGLNIVGDRENGQLYHLDLNATTDAGSFIERRAGWPHMMTDGSRVSYPSFVADMQGGTADAPVDLPDHIVLGAAYSATTTAVNTTFTAPNDTLLQNYYNPWGLHDIGSQYTRLGTSIDLAIEDNQLTSLDTGDGLYLASGIPTAPDIVGKFQAIPENYNVAPKSGSEVFLLVRATVTGSGGYKIAVQGDGTQFVALLAVIGGTSVSVDAGLLDDGYFQAYISTIGNVVTGSLQRSTDKKWLAPDATWQTTAVNFAQFTDVAYTTAGRVVIGGTW